MTAPAASQASSYDATKDQNQAKALAQAQKDLERLEAVLHDLRLVAAASDTLRKKLKGDKAPAEMLDRWVNARIDEIQKQRANEKASME